MCEPKEWTLMFYFATDNPLAISAVSQLKAIKDAGFHPDANVVAQFDPFTEGTPTHVFDVNVVNKLKARGAADIGFKDDELAVRSLIEDKLWRDEETTSPPPAAAGATTSNHELVRNALNRVLQTRYNINYKPPVAPNVNSNFNPISDRLEEPVRRIGPPDACSARAPVCRGSVTSTHARHPARPCPASSGPARPNSTDVFQPARVLPERWTPPRSPLPEIHRSALA